MQTGFVMVETGGVRRRHEISIMLKNVVGPCVTAISWWLVGFGIAFGDHPDRLNGFIGTQWFVFTDWETSPTPGSYWIWFYQWTFCAASCTIVSGAMAERTRFRAYLIFCAVCATIVYPFVAHWCWAPSGWMSAFRSDPLYGNGVIDFAGSGVVHMTGGICALTGAIIVGARIDRFNPRRSSEFEPSNIPLMTLGTFILWFGWYGFNGGSTLALINGAYEVSSLVVVNTTLSAAIAGITGLALARLFLQDWNLPITLNATLAGLVSITAPCAVVRPWAAIIIGFVSAWVYFWVSRMYQNRLKIDDPIDASVVHLGGGLWGVLSVGLFADIPLINAAYGKDTIHGGLFMGQGGQQLAIQVLQAAVIIGWGAAWSIGMWFVLKAGKVLRVSEAAERALLTEFDDETALKPIVMTNPVNGGNDGEPVANVIAFDESSSEQKAKTPKAPTTLMVADSSDDSSEVSKDNDSDSDSGSNDSS
jgi:Amt family ammonium transporter